MSEIAFRKTNENCIWWEPVPATTKPFTSIHLSFALQLHVPMAVAPSAGLWTTMGGHSSAGAGGNSIVAMAPSAARHGSMLKMAGKCPPDQSWFDEDFTALRHPER